MSGSTTSIPAFAHWLSGTGSKLIASVTDIQEKNRTEMGYLQDEFQAAGIDAVMVKPLNPGFKTSENYFGVLKVMVEYSGPETQWTPTSTPCPKTSLRFGVGAIWPSGAPAHISPLRLPWHLPRKSSSASKSLRSRRATSSRECVYTKSKAKLTIIPGLYQQDIPGGASGFFEASLRPINLHHWKSWFEAPVIAMVKAADFCGDCSLQRWRSGNDAVLSNGIGLLRKPYSKKRKKSYKLLGAEITQRGDLRQLYVWKGNETLGELDEVVEMIWQK
ncbi:hypothetical protein DL767_009384 [Monosporascus sp. MG133]|nr:hypothetical protein DL767_009384 [Monosporascus sp. MG133]